MKRMFKILQILLFNTIISFSQNSLNIDLVGLLPEGSNSRDPIVGVNNYAIAGKGNYVVIVDFSSENNPKEIARINKHATALSIKDKYLFVLSDSLYIYDISAIASPSQKSSFPIIGNEIIIKGNYAYIATSNQITILDISNIKTISPISKVNSYYNKIALSEDGKFLYGGTREKIDIINIQNITSPKILGTYKPEILSSWNLSYGGMQVKGKYLYVAYGCGYFRIIDVTNPEKPDSVYYLDTHMCSEMDVSIIGNYLLIQNSNILVYDITNPKAPIQKKGISTTASRIFYADNKLFTNGTGLIECFDVSSVENSKYIGGFIKLSPYKVKLYDNLAYVANTNSKCLTIIDISDKTNPITKKIIPMEQYGGNDLQIHKNKLYILDGSILKIFDLIDPLEPKLISSLSTGVFSYSMYVIDNFVFIGRVGLTIIDVNDIKSPKILVKEYKPDQSYSVIQGIHIKNDYAFVSDLSSRCLRIIDIRDKSKPIQISVDTIQYGFYGGFPREIGSVAFENYLCVSTTKDVKILDIQDPLKPLNVSNINAGNSVGEMIIIDRFLFCPSSYGIKVYDISNINNPKIVGQWYDNIYKYIYGFDTDGDHLFLTSSTRGMYIFQFYIKPEISQIKDQIIDEDSTLSIKFSVYGQDISKLQIIKESSNIELLPLDSMKILGNKIDRTLILSPIKKKSGSSQIRLKVTDGKYLSETTFWVTINKLTKVDEKVSGFEITLHPNPASDYITITSPLIEGQGLFGSPLIEGQGVFIYNSLGSCVLSTSVNFVDTSASGGQIRIDVSHLPAGVYFIRIGTATGMFVKM